ncbi:MAG: autotransporter outer membrane beta-barrel domain-containing protein [Akkermansia sp.]|nr:autotransporter outer membrane beta-barrel domain-containing protein [Akkermansia sp.]
MKPHLPKMLGTALRAALSSLSFVSVATGTLTALILAGAATQATAASPYIWTGAVSSVWDTTTENWTQDGTPTHFTSGGAATFASGVRANTVELTGNITAGALTIDGSYTFAGTGQVTATTLAGAPTLTIREGVTIKAGGTFSVSNGKVFTTKGEGKLSLETLSVAGGQVKLSSNTAITGGGTGQGDGNNKKGLFLNANSEVSISGGTTTVGGATYMGKDNGDSKLIIGSGTENATLVTTRLEMGDTPGASNSYINIASNGRLVITGTNNPASADGGNYKNGSIVLSEWGGTSSMDIYGELYSQGAQMRSGDQTATVNIHRGATVAIHGFTQFSGKKATKYVVEDGARIVVGAGGITQTSDANSPFTIGSAELGLSTSTVTVSTALTLTGAEGLVFNTNQYVWGGDKMSITQGETAGTFNVNGALGGIGSIIVTGKGTVNFAAANTYQGKTTVESGTLRVSSNGNIGEGIVTIKSGGTLSVEKNLDLTGGKLVIDAGGTVKVQSGKTLTVGVSDFGNAIQNSGVVTFSRNRLVTTDNLTVQYEAAGYIDETGAPSDQGFLQGATGYVELVHGGTCVDEGARFTYKKEAVTFEASTGRAKVSESEDTDWSRFELRHDTPDMRAMVDYAEARGGKLTTIDMYGGDLQVPVNFSYGTVNVYGSGKIGVETNRTIGTVNVYGTGDDGLEFNQTFSPVGNLVMQANGTLKGTVKPVNFTVRSGAEATLRGSVDATNLSIQQGGTVRALGDGNNLFALNGTVEGSVYADERGAVYVGPVGSGSGTVTVNGLVDIASGSELCVRQHGNLIVNGRLHLAGGSTFTPDGTMLVNAAGEVVAGNGIELGTLNVKGRLTAEGSGATISAAGGSVTNLNLGAGQTLVSSGDLTLEANSGADGNLSVTGMLTAAGNLHLDNVAAAAVELTSSASLVADGALDTGSVTLRRINREKVYVTAGSLTAGNTNFIVDAAAVEAMRLNDGMTLTLADINASIAGTVSVNGGQSVSVQGSDYAYYISQDAATKDIILTAREKESDYIWNGGDGDWNVPGNWQKGLTPDGDSWVQLRSGSGAITIDSDEEIARMTTYKGTDYTLKGEGSLDIEGAINMQQSSLHIGTDTDSFSVTTGSIRLSDGSALSVVDGSDFTTGSLSSDGTGASLSGSVTVTGNGGVYRGSYDDAHVTLERQAGYRGDVSQTLAADAELTVGGTDGTVTLLYGADAHLGGLDARNMTVVLNSQTEDAVDKHLTIDTPASIKDGTLAFGLDPESTAATLGTRKAPVVLTAAAGLDLTDSTVVIGQGGSYSKSALVIDTKGRTEDLVLAYVGGEGTNADYVDLSGKLFNKYYTNARLVDGAVLVDLRSGYFEQDVVQSTEHNTRAGAAMLDEALKYTNPQVNNPDGELAGIMDALESGHIAHNRVQQIAAGISGASTAALGMAASQDVDRQLRAIRNRTTTMGVGDGADRTGMPFVNAWINAEADYRQLDADNTLAGYKMTSWGGTLGFDVDCTPRFTFGLAVTAMHGDFSAKSAETAEGDLDRTYLTAFAHYTHRAWTHTLIATGGWYDTELERSINYGTRTANTKGDSDGSAIGLMYEVGYTIALTEDATTCIQPLFNVSWRHSSIGGYSEKGSETALTVGDMEANVTTFALGARLQSAYGAKPCNRSSLFEARALAKLACGDKDLDGKVNLSGLPTHTVKSAETGNFGVEIGAGVTIPMLRDNDALFLDLSAEFWSGFANVNGVIGYRVNF